METKGYGAFIKHHRKSSGFKSQRQLADKTGISSATLSRIEAEVQKPMPETLQILAKHLHTTSLVELMVMCGYWDEDDLLTPISYDLSGNNHVIKETPSQYQTEKEFVEKIDLSDDELIKQFKIVVDGRELTDKEMKKIIAQVRLDRQFGD